MPPYLPLADLMDVVAAWAAGTHFFDIYKMMEVFEVSGVGLLNLVGICYQGETEVARQCNVLVGPPLRPTCKAHPPCLPTDPHLPTHPPTHPPSLPCCWVSPTAVTVCPGYLLNCPLSPTHHPQGSLVRAIRRLEELLRQLAAAMRTVSLLCCAVLWSAMLCCAATTVHWVGGVHQLAAAMRTVSPLWSAVL